MAWFFLNDSRITEQVTLTGTDARHISRSLRMKVGEHLTLCTPDGRRHSCTIVAFSPDTVTVHVDASTVCEQEPTVKVSLYVALLKGDKLDDVVQKAVELGAYGITPFFSARCISRPDEKALLKKVERWQKIAASAASQSRRGIIPTVHPCISFDELCGRISRFDRAAVFYECGGEPIGDILCREDRTLALITGSEGGFEESEIRMLVDFGARVATLGKRILRAQTAPIAALSAAMVLTGNFG